MLKLQPWLASRQKPPRDTVRMLVADFSKPTRGGGKIMVEPEAFVASPMVRPQNGNGLRTNSHFYRLLVSSAKTTRVARDSDLADPWVTLVKDFTTNKSLRLEQPRK
jgi:hypothetical protein